MSIRTNGRKVAEKTEELAAASRKAASDGLSRARSYIVENPLRSVLLGLGAGYLAASLFRPRS